MTISISKVETRLQLLRRLEESDDYGYCSCVTCGNPYHYKDMHGGHFLARECKEVSLMRIGINPQCQQCNSFDMQAKQSTRDAYRAFMIDSYGIDTVETLEAIQRARKAFKIGKPALHVMLKEINAEIKVHTKRVGG